MRRAQLVLLNPKLAAGVVDVGSSEGKNRKRAPEDDGYLKRVLDVAT
jgi:hypothetical protein